MFTLASAFLLGGVSPIDFAGIERSFLKSRQEITAAHVTFTVKRFSKASHRDEMHRYEIWADGTKLRCDHTQDIPGIGPVRRVACANGQVVGWTFVGDDQSQNSKIYKRAESLQKSYAALFHPRLIGACFSWIETLYTARLDGFIGSNHTGTQTVAEETRDSIRCVRSTWINEKKHRVRIWMAPELGNSLVRVTIDSSTDATAGDTFPRTELTVKVQADPESKSYYPVSQEYKHFNEKGEAEDFELVRFEQSQFNRPIPASVFEIKSFGLGAELYITHEDRSKTGVYRNGDFVQRGADSSLDTTPAENQLLQPLPVNDPDKTTTRQWLYGIGIGLLALAAVWMVSRRISHSRRAV